MPNNRYTALHTILNANRPPGLPEIPLPEILFTVYNRPAQIGRPVYSELKGVNYVSLGSGSLCTANICKVVSHVYSNIYNNLLYLFDGLNF